MFIKTRITNKKETIVYCDLLFEQGNIENRKLDYCKLDVFNPLTKEAIQDIFAIMNRLDIDCIDEIETKQKPTIF